MSKIGPKLAVAFLVFVAGIFAAPLPAAALDSVAVGLPGRGIGFAPWFVGQDFGIFEKNGFTVTFASLAGNALPAALVSDGIQATPLLSEVVNANFAGFKIKAVGLLMPKTPYMIIAKKSITSVQGLKGKTIITSPPKGMPNVLLRYFLAKDGLDPSKDVKLLFIGSEAARRTLLLSGKADAIIEDVAYGFDLEQKMPSLHTVLPASRMPALATGVGLGVADDLIAHNPDLVKRMLRALVEIRRFMKAHPAEVSAKLAKELNLPPDITRKAIDGITADLAPSLVPDGRLFADNVELDHVAWGETTTVAKYKSAWDTRLAAQVESTMAGK